MLRTIADIGCMHSKGRMTNVLTFQLEHINGGTPSLMPCIDAVPLADLVATFERANGRTDPAGGYGGIVPSDVNLGPLSSCFLGKEERLGSDNEGEIYALFCECGEAGCWPLVAHVHATARSVIWADFRQPYRPKRNYSGFGPFEFARSQYEQAVAITGKLKDIA